jgi:hypothetical protein
MTDTYLGNRNLKRAYVEIEFEQEQIREYLKCAKDPIYFCEEYIKIISIDEGLVPYEPYEFQKEMIRAGVDGRFVICKMPRQVGKTTTVAALILWMILFNESYAVAILANKEKQAREILGRIQLAYEHLPKWLQQGVVEWNKGNIELENGSKIVASSTSSSAVRGQSYNLIYLDEFAFVPRNIQESFFRSVYPTITSGKTSKVMITSTPNGMDLFYKLWTDAENKKNSYIPVSVHWSDVPGRNEAWRAEIIRNTSEEQFRVEFECTFVGSTNTLLSTDTLIRMVYADPIKEDHNVHIFEEPIKNHQYAITVDTSRGVGLDYSAFVVFDVTSLPYKIVATYKDNLIQPMLYPTLIANLGNYYNEASICVEINDNGQQIADILFHDLEYENLISTATAGRKGVRIGAGFGATTRRGLRTTTVVKRIGCANLKSLIEGNKLVVNDYRIVDELSTFILDKTSYNAEQGHNDDLVMCLVIFSWMVNQNYFKDLTNLDVRRAMLEENERQLEDQLTPFGLIDDGSDLHEEPTRMLSNDEFDNFLRF